MGAIACAQGLTPVAKATGLGRESLYEAVSSDGNPEFGTILPLLKAFGLRTSVKSTGTGALA